MTRYVRRSRRRFRTLDGSMGSDEYRGKVEEFRNYCHSTLAVRGREEHRGGDVIQGGRKLEQDQIQSSISERR